MPTDEQDLKLARSKQLPLRFVAGGGTNAIDGDDAQLAELVAHFQRGVPHSVLSTNVLFAIFLVVLFWKHQPHTQILLWLAAVTVIAAANGFMLQTYRDQPERYLSRSWARYFSIGAIINGINWGIGGVLLYTPAAPVESMFVLLIIAGIASGVSAIQVSLLLGYFGFIVPALLIPAVGVVLTHGMEHAVVTILMSLYLLVIAYIGMTNRKMLLKTIQLRFEKDELLNEVKRSENYFRALIDNASDLIGVLGFDGKLQFISPSVEQVLGYSAETLVGENVLDLIHPGDQQSARDSLRAVASGDDLELSGERRYRHHDGFWVILESRGRILDKSRKMVLVSARDVTERSRMEQELISAKVIADRANQAKGRFLAHMSHEIRTPMHAILAMAEILKNSELREDQLQWVGTLGDAGQHLLNLINDILDYSSFESGSVKLYPESFDLQQLVESVCGLLIVQAENKGVTLHAEISPEVSTWRYGDAHRLRQILINLIGNGLKFTSQGEVALKISQQTDERVEIAVSDTGLGIAADQLQTVFDSFEQGEQNLNVRGTGLGLAITRRLVTAMAGEIQVESELGRGSRFALTVHLPASMEPKPVAGEVGADEIGGQPESIRVLVADDEPINRLVMEDFLRPIAHTLDVVTNGQEAVARALVEEYDIILMDMRMPVMDGLTATQMIRDQESRQGRQQVPIIALSAAVLEDERESFTQAGCTSFLAKPVSREALLGEMGRYVGGAD